MGPLFFYKPFSRVEAPPCDLLRLVTFHLEATEKVNRMRYKKSANAVLSGPVIFANQDDSKIRRHLAGIEEISGLASFPDCACCCAIFSSSAARLTFKRFARACSNLSQTDSVNFFIIIFRVLFTPISGLDSTESLCSLAILKSWQCLQNFSYRASSVPNLIFR